MKVNRWIPWIYALPMIVFVVGIFAYPIATLFLYSVQNVGASANAASSFAGLANLVPYPEINGLFAADFSKRQRRAQ